MHKGIWIQTEMCPLLQRFSAADGLHDVPTGRKQGNLFQLSKTRVHRDVFQFASTN